jgi:hypothetical protein
MNSGNNNTPSPPNPVTVANAQTGSNQSTALYESMLNMQDQRTPYGSLTYQNAGTWQYKDPSTGKTVTVPKFMASQVLSPNQQGLLDQTQQFDARYNQMALDQAAAIKDKLSTPFAYNPGVHEQWAGGLYDKLQQPGIDRADESLRQQMANRGLNYGTEAYDLGMQQFYEGNQRARDSFMLDSYQTGLGTALTERNQPLKEGQALMGAANITEPGWISGGQSGVAPTDVGGIYGQNYNQQLARSQQQQASSAGMWGALGQLGGAALGGWMASDKRVKKNIKSAGTDPESGLPVKEWTYKSGGERHATPLAQDVEKQYPQAVQEQGGVKRVNWMRVPGGQKFAQDGFVDPRLYGQPGQSMNSLPDAKMYGHLDLNDPMTSVRAALPPEMYQEAAAKGGNRAYDYAVERWDAEGNSLDPGGPELGLQGDGRKYIDNMPRFEVPPGYNPDPGIMMKIDPEEVRRRRKDIMRKGGLQRLGERAL